MSIHAKQNLEWINTHIPVEEVRRRCTFWSIVHIDDEIVKCDLLKVDVQHEWLVKQVLIHLDWRPHVFGHRGGVCRGSLEWRRISEVHWHGALQRLLIKR